MEILDNVNVGGKATAKFTGLEPNFIAGADTFVTADFTVQAAQKKDQTIEANDLKMTYGDAPKAIGAKAQTALTYTPDNSGVVSVDANGNVTALKAGTAKVTTVLFDNKKLKRLVPGFCCTTRFDQGVRGTLENIFAHPELQVPDPEFDAWCDRVIAALERAKAEI